MECGSSRKMPMSYPNFNMKDKHLVTICGLLHMYNYQLPFVVAQYFMYIYIHVIISSVPIKYSFLKRFEPYKRNVKFVFDTTAINDYQRIKIRFSRVVIEELTESQYQNFMENNVDLWGPQYDLTINHDDVSTLTTVYLDIAHR